MFSVRDTDRPDSFLCRCCLLPLLHKVFKSEFGPDGSVRDELDVACVVDHQNLTHALGVVNGAEQWLVMERVPGKPLAERPDFSSVLRCRWGAGRRFEPVLVLAVLLQVR